MDLHNALDAARTLWLESAGGPELLAGCRMITGALSAMAAGAALLNSLRNIELEAIWTREDCRRFRIIGWLRTLGLVLAALYFFCAGVFEIDRTSSPVRLMVGNVAFSVMFLGSLLDSLAWRNHYKRKRMITEVKAGQR